MTPDARGNFRGIVVPNTAPWPPDRVEQPQVPRSGKCDCGGELVEVKNPKPGVASAVLCASCEKWIRWELEVTYGPGWPE